MSTSFFLTAVFPDSYGAFGRFTMEYGKSNIFPKHDSDFMGAIFVCNNLTKKECFKRKLFGLPSVHSDLVKQIKTGMILFLFEPDERKLHGIFQATSDGAMNIVPRAFSISNKRFPAQVRFGRLCVCKPLSENEFREAIDENYFTAIKFSFALLGRQVCRLILLFSSRSYLPYDQLPRGLQSEFMKIFENSCLARTKVIGNENLPKFDAAGYSMYNNIQSTRNSFLLGPSKNHLKKYKNHEQNDITLQNHELRGQREFYPTVYHSAKLQQQNQMLSTSCYDLSSDVIPDTPSTRCSYSSSRFLCKPPPSVALGSDLLEQKLTFSRGNSLDAQTPHIRNQSYTSVYHIEIKDHPLSNNSGIYLSKSSRLSEPSQLTLHTPEGHVNFHDTSLCSRNGRSYSGPIRLEDDSWNIQDWSSVPDYIPNSKGETSVNNGYFPVLEVDFAYAKEAFDLPSRKENSPSASQYDYHSGFTSDINNTGNCSFDFSYNDKKSVPKSNSFQKRCNVFQRLSLPPKINKKFKKIKYHSSLDRMVDAFSHQRSQGIKVCGKLGNLASLESDAPLDNITELRSFEKDSLVEINPPQVQVLDDGNGFSIPNFKRRSAVKQRSTGASDFTPCVDKCKKRKLIRPSFSEEDNSSPVKDCQNLNLPYPGIKSSLDFRIEDSISKKPTEDLPISMESDAHSEGVGSVGHLGPLSTILKDNAGLSNTDSLTVNMHCSQHILDSESKKINSYCLMGDESVDGNPKENSHPLTRDFIPLSVEEEHKVINTAKNCMDSDMNHVVVKMDAPDFPLGISCKTKVT